VTCRVARFSSVQHTKKYTKQLKNIGNGHTTYQITTKRTKVP
jgi:hypothetical protein